MTVELVERSYLNTWGEPSSREELQARDGRELAVWHWEPSDLTEGLHLYATVGGSAYPMPGSPTHRLEFVGALSKAVDVKWSLGSVALTASEDVLLSGHTVSLDEPLWPGSSMRTWLVVVPEEPLVPAISVPGGNHIRFAECLPLTSSEKALLQREGFEALIGYLSDHDIFTGDVSRSG